ncbi:MAG: LCP family protein [Anaerolineales bacterium]|nr:LCP family protein [Anaerolineales bacterium]
MPKLHQQPPAKSRSACLSWVAWSMALIVLMFVTGFVTYLVSREISYTQNYRTAIPTLPRFEPVLSTDVIETQAPAATTPDRPTPLPLPSQILEITPTLVPWNGTERVTILLMGLDYRDWANEVGPSRSDTMILLTMDPVAKTAGVLSIPRDLWAAIPGVGHAKINTAHAYGGPGLSVQTVELVIGVPIHYYAVVDFDAFIRFIDELGGVKLDIPERIKIDPLGDDNTRYLQPGVQVLPGELALAYARNRSQGDGDFARARRQQQVIMGIRDRILDLELLPMLISKAPTLYTELAAGIKTNMQLDEVLRLAAVAAQVPRENIRQGVIDINYVAFGWSPNNLSILVPYPDRIRVLRDEIFDTSGSLSPLAVGDPLDLLAQEGTSIAVWNGSDDPGLTLRTANYLRAQGATVVETRELDELYANTTLVDHVGRPYTMQYLTSLFDVNTRHIQFNYEYGNAVDVVVVLGDDWAATNNLP